MTTKIKLALLLAFVAVVALAQRVVSSGQITHVSGSGSVLVTTKGTQTAGDCVTIDATGNHVAAGAACSAGGSSGLVLLEQHTASNSAALNFTGSISSTYDEYVIEILNLTPATNAASALLQFSTNAGSSYDSGTNYAHQAFRWINSSQAAAGANSGATSITIDGGGGVDKLNNTASNGGLCGTFHLFNPLSSSAYKLLTGQTTFYSSGSLWDGASVAAQYLSTSAVNAFSISMSSGNITSGTVRVYGIAK
jgi:hypothetical protein